MVSAKLVGTLFERLHPQEIVKLEKYKAEIKIQGERTKTTQQDEQQPVRKQLKLCSFDINRNKNSALASPLIQKTFDQNVYNYDVWPSILLILLGSWSDRNQSRKVLIILPLIGQTLSNVGLLISTYFFYEISMELNVLIDALPAALTGGASLLLVGIFSYTSETTADDKKTWRIGIVHIMLTISTTTGTALSGVIYRWIGFYGVFSIASALYLLGAIYGFYCIREDKLETKKSQVLKDIFNIKKSLTTYKFIGKKENCDKTKQLFLITFVAVLNIGPNFGENAVLYLYTRYKFHWDEVDFSMFFTYFTVAHLIGSTFALSLFSKYLKIDDALLGALSVTSRIFGGIIYTLAPTALIFYIAFIASRSIMSKIIPPEEIGRANSIFGIAETLTMLIYAPMYSALYKATLGHFSGSFFVLGVTLSVPAVISYIWIYFYQKKKKMNEKMDVLEENRKSLLSLTHQPE
ncbi:hypothetical protein RN001_000964 [Aquatica leii]|uniref:Proton-coupled folate transporter n=1 Tax=Aquatica leii TaxID=1421715 RepID=A0AAN7PFW4_9COLE|nr:hypothetical protein RN001_000964 [Aquatica leii]